MLREVCLPRESEQVVYFFGLEKLPDPKAGQQATIKVIILVSDSKDLESALLPPLILLATDKLPHCLFP